MLKQKIKEFCSDKQDILYVLLGHNNEKDELVLVMQDSTKDNVLDYNDFCFQIKNEFAGIDDFLVLDINTVSGIYYQYTGMDILYMNKKCRTIPKKITELSNMPCNKTYAHTFTRDKNERQKYYRELMETSITKRAARTKKDKREFNKRDVPMIL